MAEYEMDQIFTKYINGINHDFETFNKLVKKEHVPMIIDYVKSITHNKDYNDKAMSKCNLMFNLLLSDVKFIALDYISQNNIHTYDLTYPNTEPHETDQYWLYVLSVLLVNKEQYEKDQFVINAIKYATINMDNKKHLRGFCRIMMYIYNFHHELRLPCLLLRYLLKYNNKQLIQIYYDIFKETSMYHDHITEHMLEIKYKLSE